MIIIFTLSSQNGTMSSDLSIRVARRIAKLIFFKYESMSEQLKETIVNGLNGFVRKLAHFSIYALLGINVSISVSFITNKIRSRIIMSVFVCGLYAALDETHQYFVSGRSGAITDVLIDTSGSVFGIIAVLTVCSVIYYIKNKRFDT